MVEPPKKIAAPAAVPKRGKTLGSVVGDLAAIVELIALCVLVAVVLATYNESNMSGGWLEPRVIAALTTAILLPITTVHSLLRLRWSIGAGIPIGPPCRVPLLQALILAVNVILAVCVLAGMLLV